MWSWSDFSPINRTVRGLVRLGESATSFLCHTT